MTLLSVYHRLPYWTRVCAASLNGYALRSLRYGRETDRRVAEALEQETWTKEKWQTWEQARVAGILDRAARHVPYYRRQWNELRRRGERKSHEVLDHWPILEKEPLRQAPQDFIADDCVHKLHVVQTSGTSGTPLQLRQSRQTIVAWYALTEARARLWYGVSRHDTWAILGGRLVARVGTNRPPFWVWNSGLRQLYMSSYHLSAECIPAYLDVIAHKNIAYMWGYTSSLYTMAQEILRLGRRDLAMKVVITNAEPLYAHQREVISEAFQCPVRETYGMAELAAAASECEHGRLHLWPSVGLVEVCERGRRLPLGQSGDLVCTGLLNSDMPLIRYRVRDRGALPAREAPCQCGRTLPQLEGLEGRIDDTILTPDGRLVGRLDPVLKGRIPVHELQIVQEDLHRLRVLYVPAPGFDTHAEREIVHRLRQYVGPLAIEMEPVERVPRGANGKFRAVICNLSDHQRRLACGEFAGTVR